MRGTFIISLDLRTFLFLVSLKCLNAVNIGIIGTGRLNKHQSSYAVNSTSTHVSDTFSPRIRVNSSVVLATYKQRISDVGHSVSSQIVSLSFEGPLRACCSCSGASSSTSRPIPIPPSLVRNSLYLTTLKRRMNRFVPYAQLFIIIIII